jgi:hypothetical protein
VVLLKLVEVLVEVYYYADADDEQDGEEIGADELAYDIAVKSPYET